jgi:hypothetical protein
VSAAEPKAGPIFSRDESLGGEPLVVVAHEGGRVKVTIDGPLGALRGASMSLITRDLHAWEKERVRRSAFLTEVNP